MARLIGEAKPTTKAEQIILEFLYNHKGVEFTTQEIEDKTGIRADLIPDIMDNLRWKGFEVGSRHDKHFFIKNTFMTYIIGGAVIAFMIILLLWSFDKYLATCPGCPPDDYQVTTIDNGYLSE